jgi:hypothetical protein
MRGLRPSDAFPLRFLAVTNFGSGLILHRLPADALDVGRCSPCSRTSSVLSAPCDRRACSSVAIRGLYPHVKLSARVVQAVRMVNDRPERGAGRAAAWGPCVSQPIERRFIQRPSEFQTRRLVIASEPELHGYQRPDRHGSRPAPCRLEAPLTDGMDSGLVHRRVPGGALDLDVVDTPVRRDVDPEKRRTFGSRLSRCRRIGRADLVSATGRAAWVIGGCAAVAGGMAATAAADSAAPSRLSPDGR